MHRKVVLPAVARVQPLAPARVLDSDAVGGQRPVAKFREQTQQPRPAGERGRGLLSGQPVEVVAEGPVGAGKRRPGAARRVADAFAAVQAVVGGGAAGQLAVPHCDPGE